MPSLRWAHGLRQSAASWGELEQQVRLLQFTRQPRWRFRLMMCRLAWVWSRTLVAPWGGSERFLRGLAKAGLCELTA